MTQEVVGSDGQDEKLDERPAKGDDGPKGERTWVCYKKTLLFDFEKDLASFHLDAEDL